MILSSIQRQNIISKLNGLLSELLYDLNLAEEIVLTKQIPIANFRDEAMTHLLITNYITGEKLFHTRISGSLEIMENLNKRKDSHFLGQHLGWKTDFGLMEHWLNYQIPAFKWLIQKTKEYRSLIKKRDLEYSEPPILMINDEHKKLLEDEDLPK